MRWTLPELANFESLLGRAEVSESDREVVSEALAGLKKKGSEAKKREIGLRAWFENARKGAEEEEAGNRLRITLGVVQALVVVLSVLAGITLMGSLIERVGVTEGKAYNVWKLLAIPIGGQWIFLLLTLASWLILRRNDRKMTLFEEAFGQIIKGFAGKAGARGWNELYRAGAAYREILGWRIARISQWAAVAFNVGLIAGFLGILLFLEINFFWATTLEDIGRPQLEMVTQGLSSPWSWAKPAWVPSGEAFTLTQLQIGELNAEGKPEFWYPFILASLVVWGLLPRLILTVFSYVMEGKALGKLTFMEKRHRDLWRQLTPRVSVTADYSVADDGVVLIDVGGTDATTDELRPFLLQQLRVNPTERFRAGVVEGDQKAEALASLKKAKRGVVLLVESWNLSPKQLVVLHGKIREVVTERSILYLVLGLPKGGVTQAPSEEEMKEWEHFVTELNDPEAEIFAYQTAVLKDPA